MFGHDTLLWFEADCHVLRLIYNRAQYNIDGIADTVTDVLGFLDVRFYTQCAGLKSVKNSLRVLHAGVGPSCHNKID